MPKRKLPANEIVTRLYDEGFSPSEIAERFGVATVTVACLLRRIGHPMRSGSEAQQMLVARGRKPSVRYWLGKRQPSEMVERRIEKIRGENHWLWKGGTADRREYRKVVDKANCAKCGSTDRLLIHHDNRDHYDNRPDNLVVLCLSCHSSVHKKAYWDAIHAGQEPPKSNAPNNWRRGGG